MYITIYKINVHNIHNWQLRTDVCKQGALKITQIAICDDIATHVYEKHLKFIVAGMQARGNFSELIKIVCVYWLEHVPCSDALVDYFTRR